MIDEADGCALAACGAAAAGGGADSTRATAPKEPTTTQQQGEPGKSQGRDVVGRLPELLLEAFDGALKGSDEARARPALTILSANGGPLLGVAARLGMGDGERQIERFYDAHERWNLRYVIEGRHSLATTAEAVAACVFHGEEASDPLLLGVVSSDAM